MPLNIKSDEAHELARRISAATGDSLTVTVIQALREKLARVEAPDRLAEEILAIGRDCAAHVKAPLDTIDHAELLYDERGLPK